MDDPRIEVKLQRCRAIIHCTDPKFLVQNNLHNLFTVFDFKAQKLDITKRYAYVTSQGDIELPRCTNLNKLRSKLQNLGIYDFSIIDDLQGDLVPHKMFVSKIDIREGFKIRDEFQKEAISYLCSPLHNNMHVRLLSLPTGYGKTFCAIYAMCFYKMKTLVIVSSLTKQWIQELLDKTTCPYNQVFEIAESINTVKDLISGKINANKYSVFVASTRTLANAIEQGLYLKLLYKLGIGLKIIDEFHFATYTNNKFDLAYNVNETIYLTATAMRSNPAENYTFSCAYHTLPKFGGDIQEYAKKYLNTMWIMYNTNPTVKDLKSCSSFFGFNTVKFCEHIFSDEHIDDIVYIIKYVLDLTLNKIDSDEKILIIVELLKYCSQLVNILRKIYPNVSIGEYTTNIKAEDKRDELKNQIIIGTNEGFGQGIDFNNKLRMLINTTTYNSKITATQLPGRIRDIIGKDCWYVDIVNRGFKRVWDHYVKRKKIIDRFSKRVVVKIAREDF